MIIQSGVMVFSQIKKDPFIHYVTVGGVNVGRVMLTAQFILVICIILCHHS